MDSSDAPPALQQKKFSLRVNFACNERLFSSFTALMKFLKPKRDGERKQKMLRFTNLISRAASISLLLFFFQAFVFASESEMNKWEKFDFSKQSVQLEDIQNLKLEDLRLLRGIVFGKHGRIFKDLDIREYLKTRSWFKPNPKFNNAMLNDIERKNIDVIREAESLKHTVIEPGDLRFWQTKLMTEDNLGYHTAAEWRILIAEVEAIHGKRFNDEPWLQKYFEERYWYKASTNYDPKVLTEIERRNIQTMIETRNKERNVAVSPGEMDLFQNVLLTEEILKGLTLNELRLMRNEFFARHGRRFNERWLAQHFWGMGYDWYEPVAQSKETPLSEIEKQNVETIQRYENKVREQLMTSEIESEMLAGLFSEDVRTLRNEIFARHGKIFKDKKLQNYFSSFDWYNPDSTFNEKNLTAMEKKNVATLLEYEKDAISKFAIVEG
jgi:hypothetical protein